jgi:ArsR family transcriptional regulator, cadmium/lead-responsive transcriptional repressor
MITLDEEEEPVGDRTALAGVANPPDAMVEQRQEITAKFFHGLSDLTRLRIVELLLDEGELNVSELVAALGQQQSRVSNHLACLRWCGYVDSRRGGKFVYYRVADPRVRQLVELARAVIADNAAAIVSCTRM